MSELKIKDKLWTDPRLYRLQARLGHFAAVGSLVNLWRTALANPKMKGVLIPELFKSLEHWKDLLECEFVSERQSGFYVKGMKRILEEIEKERSFRSRGGKKSAESRKAKYGTAIPNNAVNCRSQLEVSSKSVRSQLEVSSAPKRVNKTQQVKENRINELIATYATCFKKRYKVNPAVTGKDIGILKALSKTISHERLNGLLQVYLQMSDQWFEKKRHDIHTFNISIQKISVAAQTGKDPDMKRDPFAFMQEKGLELV